MEQTNLQLTENLVQEVRDRFPKKKEYSGIRKHEITLTLSDWIRGCIFNQCHI